MLRMRGNLKKMFGWVPVRFTLIFYLVNNLIGIPEVQNASNYEILKLTAECVYSLLIVSVCDKGNL